MQASFNLATSSENLLPKDGHVEIFTHVVEADYTELLQELDWKHKKIHLFGHWVLQPRLSAWYGDAGTEYQYSGLLNVPKAWTPSLLKIKQVIEKKTKQSFNSVLANYYRDGQDSMAWHQDNEPELGPEPIIASLSLGETRRFQFRHKTDKSLKTLSFDLVHGSLLLMSGQTQNFWQHQVPKTKRKVGGRINLTFRKIINNNK